jgi:hypothetical protein
MKLLSTDSFRAWATGRSIGRSLDYPNSPDLAFRYPEATWYRYRVAGQPDPEALTALIVTTAAAGHGGYLFPPYRDGAWTDPLDHSHVDLPALGTELTTTQAAAFTGALELTSSEIPIAVRAMFQALDAGSLWELCFIPEHARIILTADEDGDLVGLFPDDGPRQSFDRALRVAGWVEPTDPDPRVSETDPWLTL